MLSKFIQIKDDFEDFAKDYFLAQSIQSPRLKEAMAYSFLNGGKRIRAILSFLSGACFNCDPHNIKHIALALEAIHAYSLIHDDLPAMDDDDLRRGKPTCHIQFDEATAILAGDALQTLAFQALSELKAIDIKQLQKALFMLATHAGSQGMVDGQQLDIDAEGQTQDITSIETIHRLKTGKLLTAAVVLPFIASPYYTDQTVEKHLIAFSQCIGLAFQVKDDLLEVTSDTATLGKNNMSDLKLNKSTYPSLLGVEKTQQLLDKLFTQSMAHLQQIKGHDTTSLAQLAEYIIRRTH
ncbi:MULTISPECIES: polyprenyl synthetase family protein [Cysteiniphilum]|uniref:Farnesyl diphosphate synthase n=1 Tax=Cysteiniphilum litorale TaxID=2056700 RepID=A0A8J2Z4E9_9GAMM|nr:MULTISPECIES: farnesyl diphosphate synthase [Cysteiniphilum]GGF97731.1 farnesyl diphosphate synthase [Cysteiniphilum litorale]